MPLFKFIEQFLTSCQVFRWQPVIINGPPTGPPNKVFRPLAPRSISAWPTWRAHCPLSYNGFYLKALLVSID
ncbi:uncharacterized protein N7529_011478 [Penicillium soppii]|uniref:uncharacterized protein n=1 Tax=Penicillium soppii TaxID=69789 RepID=UPI002546FEDD|nr:uncharacterized protein N7529_011478 [Penicillium soppii]KAJ5852093.1 hypothetical protein N7529_011478 [Penicillium soppii]